MQHSNRITEIDELKEKIDKYRKRGPKAVQFFQSIIVSVDELNVSPWGLIVVCPITTFRKEIPFRLHVLISPPDGGIKHDSIVRCDQIKSISIQRFAKKWGAVDEPIMMKVEYILRKILNI